MTPSVDLSVPASSKFKYILYVEDYVHIYVMYAYHIQYVVVVVILYISKNH
jgi:hypothetical protein